MCKLELPEEWTVVNGEYENDGVFAMCNWDAKIIELRKPYWIPQFIWNWLISVILEHEIGHANGLKACSTPWGSRTVKNQKIYCLGYEGKEDGWKEKLYIPFQLLYGLKHCKDCLKVMEEHKCRKKM